MSIRKSLQGSILFMAVIPVILMAILAYVVTVTKYTNITKENTTQTAQDYSRGLVSQLQTQIVEAQALADTNNVKSYLLEKVNSPDTILNSDSVNAIKDSIVQLSKNFDYQANYYIYDIDGYLTLSSSDSSAPDWSEIMKEPIDSYEKVTLIAQSEFKKDTLDIIVPVIVKKNVIGLIRANISADYFHAFLSNKDTTCFLVNDNGQCLFDYHAESKADEQFLEYLNNSVLPDTQTDKNASFSNLSDTYTGNQDYIYGYATIPEYNWIYVTRQTTSNLATIVSTLPFVFLILLAIVIILSVVLSRNLATKYTEPLIELSDKMQQAADGQLDVHCSVTSEDEFGHLSNSFNQMMDIISTNYNEISSARKKLEESQEELENNYARIEKLAYTDALTGLYNRMAFFKYANDILSNNKNGLTKHAIIFIDLDGFKAINDTLGHDYGDLLLQAVTAQFASLVDPDDILARNGGDEFVILRNHIDSTENLEHFLDSLVSIASHPFVLDDETVHVSISAGVAIFPQNGLSLSELMKNADIAMYTSKGNGKNSYTFFNSTMEDEVNRRNDLIDILRDAIDNKDIYLLYQPQADISTGEIIGCEALMRLNSPIVGFVSPDEFIPVAEECGLIDELGEWALLEACQFNQRLIDAGFKPLRISVNVSTAQLRGDRLIKAIEALPQKTSMPLKYLEIELTESVLMKNFDHNLALINRMKELDIHIALDDFGTGYSSFSYLTKIPINTLKIDKSFIAGICEDENDTYIAGTIINLAHQLGITVIAEGVETIEQLRILQGQMCDILQGYFFSRAIPEDEFVEMLKINS